MKKRRSYKILKRVLLGFLSLIILVVIFGFFYMRTEKFGKLPSGERKARIEASPNYVKGKFRDLHTTPTLADGRSMFSEGMKFFVNSYKRQTPIDSIPHVKTDLLHLPIDSNVVVWFGHSSCFIQLDGKRLLVDPNFSGNASPVPGTVPAYPGSNSYSVVDLPGIDYLLISHDHYDHLDFETVILLQEKTKHVVCGLGVGADFEYWGYPKEKIIEKDWHERLVVDSGFSIYGESTRHQSGRTFNQNQTLWMSYVIKSPTQTIFISGDGGYDTHFAEIGKKYGPIDLAILENGQYDSAWRFIHMLPVQTLQAARDLKARRLMPVHNSKFLLGRHEWDAPMQTLAELNKDFRIPLVTPEIGQVVNLNDSSQVFTQWWTKIR